MSPVLKLDRHDEEKEIWFEIKYQLSLTTRQRFEMMFKKTKEMIRLLEKHGRRKAFQVIKRTGGSGRPENEEDFLLQTIKKMKHTGRKKI